MSFFTATREGCAFCRQLLAAAVEGLGTIDVESAMEHSMLTEGKDKPEFWVRLASDSLSLHYDNEKALVRTNFDVYPSKEGAQKPEEPTTSTCRSVTEVRDLASSWLDRCLHHKRCRETPDAATRCRPSRLIEIIGSAGQPLRARLVAVDQQDSDTQYATLSYCWGSNRTLTLTRANFADFQHGIDVSLLPLTFRHAFEVCLALSIQYIWIDSLVIIQDLPEDWAFESKRMGDIYHNSFLSIAADAGTHSEAGLFMEDTEELPSRIQHRRSRVNYPNGKFTDTMYDFIPLDQPALCIRSQPLNQRGWVCQERLLASRILHFTTHGLTWECNTLYATAAYQYGVPPGVQGPDIQSLGAFVPPRHATSAAQAGLDRHNAWCALVTRYSSARFTYPDDRPVAIQGIVNELERTSGVKCIAGLWQDCLRGHLLWSDCSGLKPYTPGGVRNAKRKMPSFSWLSVDGEVDMFEVEGYVPWTAMYRYRRSAGVIPQSQLVGIDSQPLALTPTGLVQHVSLTFRAVLRPVHLTVSSESPTGHPILRVDEFEDAAEDCSIYPDWSRPGFQTPEAAPAVYHVILLYLLQDGVDRGLVAHGLLLENTDSTMTTFRRIGRFTLLPQGRLDSGERMPEIEWWMDSYQEERLIKLI